ncbi:DUF4011 domain-containing protein [Streptomyces sp. NPDC059496]|uniref:DUF4011 domain-containing protein n=1 Tax=Streptomyces sp. NPDC059496 TaxID=3346851 RepID=UPI0036AD183F
MHGRTAHAEPFDAGADPGSERLRAVLGGWRESLIDLGGRNRLLNFRHTRSSTLDITSPGAGPLLEQLHRGWDFAPVEEAEEESSGVTLDKAPRGAARARSANGILTQKQTQQALDTALRQLRQKANQTFNDFGLWVLWVGVGNARLA